MLSRSIHPLMLDETSHVLALLDCESLNPCKPESSVLFERAAELEQNTGCDITIAHMAKPASIEENLKEHLALRILVKRVNERFDADFDVTIRYGAGDCEDINRLVSDKNGDLLMVDHSESNDRTMHDDLLKRSEFPLWYVAKPGEIEEVSATISTSATIRSDDQVTRSVAEHIGANLGSNVRFLSEVADPAAAGDLLVTCASTQSKDALDSVEQSLVRQLLATDAEFDLLVHRGARTERLADAA